MTRLHLIKILLLCNVALRRSLLVVALRLGFGINVRSSYCIGMDVATGVTRYLVLTYRYPTPLIDLVNY